MVTAFSQNASAQFKEEAFTQQYNDDADTTSAASDTLFSFREFFGGAFHKRDARIGVMFGGSTVFIGAQQMYNRQYWKIPISYAGIGAGVGMGLHYRNKWKADETNTEYKKMSNWYFAGAGFVYWATLMDGVFNYKRSIPNQAGKATIYSILLPGLGQIYNGEAWKIPIYYGLMLGSVHFYLTNNKNYARYKWIHNQATTEDSGYDGPINASTALYYRDVFRRYRDYSIVCIIGSYLLQVIDANVFSYMHDFELSDDIAMEVTPTVISGDLQYAFNPYDPSPSLHYSGAGNNGLGLKIGISF